MRHIYFLLAFLAVSTCLGYSCNSNLSETPCIQQKGCQWKMQDTQGCNLFDCPGMDTNTCKYFSMNGQCNYNAAQPGYCRVKSSACTVKSNDGSTCNSAINCDFVPATPESCPNVGSNFGCTQIKSSSVCRQNAQCQLMSTYCMPNTEICSKQSYSNCDQTGCKVLVDSCSLKKNASEICTALTTEADCISKGCVFQNQVCSAPSKCFVNNNSCTDVCEISSGSCTYQQNFCRVYSEDECNKNFCKWVTDSPVCVNTGGYCYLETCSSKAPYCKHQDPQQSYCKPKTATNQCLNLSEDQCTNSSNSDFCEYVPSSDSYCSHPISDCSPFNNKNFCNGQNPCIWGNISTCVDIPSSSKTLSKILKTFIIFTLCILLL